MPEPRLLIQVSAAELPVRKPKKTTPEKQAALLVVIDDGAVLLGIVA